MLLDTVGDQQTQPQHQHWPAGRPDAQQPLDPELIHPHAEQYVNQWIQIVAVTKTACSLTPTRVRTPAAGCCFGCKVCWRCCSSHQHRRQDSGSHLNLSKSFKNKCYFSLFLGIPTEMNVWLCYFCRSGQLAHVVHSLIKASLENWTAVRLVLWPVLCPHMGGYGLESLSGSFTTRPSPWHCCGLLRYPGRFYWTRVCHFSLCLHSHLSTWMLKAVSFHAELRARGLFDDLLISSEWVILIIIITVVISLKEWLKRSEGEREREMRVLTKRLFAWCVGHTAE